MWKVRALFAVVQDAVSALLAPKRPHTKQPGEGVARASARLSERRAEQADIDMTPTPCRQQDRAHARWKAKRALSLRKAAAMREKQPGGAAVIR